MPKSTNLESYLNNALGVSSRNINRSSKNFIRSGKDYSEIVDLGGGSKLTISIKDGKLSIIDTDGKSIISNNALDKNNYAFSAKAAISKAIDDYRK